MNVAEERERERGGRQREERAREIDRYVINVPEQKEMVNTFKLKDMVTMTVVEQIMDMSFY